MVEVEEGRVRLILEEVELVRRRFNKDLLRFLYEMVLNHHQHHHHQYLINNNASTTNKIIINMQQIEIYFTRMALFENLCSKTSSLVKNVPPSRKSRGLLAKVWFRMFEAGRPNLVVVVEGLVQDRLIWKNP